MISLGLLTIWSSHFLYLVAFKSSSTLGEFHTFSSSKTLKRAVFLKKAIFLGWLEWSWRTYQLFYFGHEERKWIDWHRKGHRQIVKTSYSPYQGIWSKWRYDFQLYIPTCGLGATLTLAKWNNVGSVLFWTSIPIWRQNDRQKSFLLLVFRDSR